MHTHKPLPIDREIKISSKNFIVSKTDEKGKILYVNDTFCDVTGYEEIEVIGKAHNILRHPDMPAVIFFLMWKQIQNGNNIRALIKNLARSGEYYWVSTDFEIHYENNTKNYMAFRRSVPKKSVHEIEPLYEHLLKVEKAHGLEASLIYLQGFLNEKHLTFEEYMDSVLKPKGFMAIIFNKMKSTFM
ncbi:SIGNAL-TRANSDUCTION SENSOR PROTEIN-PAS/PAC domain [hydrothermal vent metagenome]|uniref:SIGNAL-TRANSDUCTION SENSOR PROTEIN-PAS/PAC domain n=1 Tax=hydrothermal vent metagenome TaxID=652676 RepID=A0A1W1C7C2_9ZZZZ